MKSSGENLWSGQGIFTWFYNDLNRITMLKRSELDGQTDR